MSAAPRFLQAIGLCALMALASGCSRKAADSPAPAPVQPSPSSTTLAPTTELSSGPIDDTPAESGLAIKKGIVTGAGDHAVFRSCDDKADLYLVDEAEGTLTQLLTEGSASPVFYIEAYGERGPVPDDLTAAKGQAGVFTLEQLLFAATMSDGRGCEQSAPDYVVSARGNEPFWSVVVTPAGMQWKQPDADAGVMFSELQSEDAEGTVSYAATAQGRKLQLIVDAQSCRDSMSGNYFAFTAKAELDGKEFKGCARVGSLEVP
ncbi:MAG: COG3650 family protein [Povalibacter sp.]